MRASTCAVNRTPMPIGRWRGQSREAAASSVAARTAYCTACNASGSLISTGPAAAHAPSGSSIQPYRLRRSELPW